MDVLFQTICERLYKKQGCSFVLALAGGGYDIIGSLTRYGSSSSSLLSAHALGSRRSFLSYIKLPSPPEDFQFVCDAATRALALHALEEAQLLSGKTDSCVGIGASSTLLKPRGEREQRRHETFVSIQTPSYTTVSSLFLKKGRSRETEETLVTLFILEAVAQGLNCDVRDLNPLQHLLLDDDKISSSQSKLPASLTSLYQKKPTCLILENNILFVRDKPLAIISGRFNPLHKAHKTMYEYAKKKTGLQAVFEVSINNPGKPLDFMDIERSCFQFESQNFPVAFTNCATFAEKSLIFPKGSIFAIGADTLKRLVDPQFYNHSLQKQKKALDTLKQRDVRFLVFSRLTKQGLVEPAHFREEIMDFGLTHLLEEVPKEEFCFEESSTELRVHLERE